jgi:REP element-mobilizing transposase RayT
VRKNKQQISVWNPRAAGRPCTLTKKEKSSKIYHRSRPDLATGKPVHVTIKTNKHIVPNLRNKILYKEIRESFKRARLLGIRIIHFTVQRDHIHFLIESQNIKQLGQSMRALSISLTKRFSRVLNRKIKALKTRYHLHILESLKEIKNVANYIKNNGKKHRVTQNVDFFSSHVSAQDFRPDQVFLEFLDDLKSVLSIPRFYATRKCLQAAPLFV